MAFNCSFLRSLTAFGVWIGCAVVPSMQTPPQIVGRGVVSTEAPEFAATFTPDGRELYFNRASADRTTLQIMTSRRTSSGDWTAAAIAPFSGTFRDVDPFITPDGRRLFFSSDRPRQPGGARAFATWYVERVGDGWSAPIDPGPPLNSTAGDVFFTMARDGAAVFTSSRDGGSRVYVTRESRGGWETPRPLTLGTTTDGSNPAIAPSGRFLVVVRAPAGGAADLFLSCRTRDGWSEPRPLTAINSDYADFAPSIDANETMLTFTSERPGLVGAHADGARPPGDLYRVTLADAGIRCGQ
jgi:Tol biopolymer transport system component